MKINIIFEIIINYCNRLSWYMQNIFYQLMAFTLWDMIVSGFKPGRTRAFELMDIKITDIILLVGEGSGLDFECLPSYVNKDNIKAFDFSPEMVRQCKNKAKIFGIHEENCFTGDAQKLPFTTELFDKIFFPLSLASIPNPRLALQEAEKVLNKSGKIIIFDKLVDDDVTIGWRRSLLNFITKLIFADINRNLSIILGNNSLLKLVHYESLENKLNGIITKYLGSYYRLAVLVRHIDYPDLPLIRAKLKSK